MQFIFVDESGDPGKPYKVINGKKTSTGSSLFYIVTALPITSEELFLIEEQIIRIKHKYKFKKEIKSTIIPLTMYKELLTILNKFNLKAYYRCINKETYKGVFAVNGNKRLHNIFDEYNLVKTVYYAAKEKKFTDAEVVIDRAERRLLDGKFDNFDKYLFKRLNSKSIKRVKFITHANSEYVFLMQISDLICGAIRDCHSHKNHHLKDVLDKQILRKIY